MSPEPRFIPEFAILGHPNEGKSSVVSTLTEDDTVRVGPFPGETRVCQSFPITVDRGEIIRFIDTPGFQNPRQTLAWMRAYTGPGEQVVQAFIDAHREDPRFRDECELLTPVARGAGIIYVADASRPLRNDDRAEMEILRLSARPRMSVINCKENETGYLEGWKMEFRRHFNSVRVFNAHHATFRERMDLLESLKGMDQDWQPAITTVIKALELDWEIRTLKSVEMIVSLLGRAMEHAEEGTLEPGVDPRDLGKTLEERYRRHLEALEQETFAAMRRLFRHNIFTMDLPPDSMACEGLFSQKTWSLLGLTPGEAAVAAGMAGGAAGALIDTAAAGLTFGIFTAIGGAIGAGSVLLGGKRFSGMRFKGVRLGRDRIRLGPAGGPELLHVLLDRSLIFYSGIINWAHGRRDLPAPVTEGTPGRGKQGVTARLAPGERAVCARFLEGLRSRNRKRRDASRAAMADLVESLLKGCLGREG
jgi:hypothetical protein